MAFCENEAVQRSFNIDDFNFETPTVGSLEWLLKLFLSRTMSEASRVNLKYSFQVLLQVMIRFRLYEYFQDFQAIPYVETVPDAEIQEKIRKGDKVIKASYWRGGTGCLLTKCLDFETKKALKRKIAKNKEYFLDNESKRPRMESPPTTTTSLNEAFLETPKIDDISPRTQARKKLASRAARKGNDKSHKRWRKGLVEFSSSQSDSSSDS